MKKIIAILLIAILLPIGAVAEEMYCRFGEVVDIEYEYDIVTVDDGIGNLWEFFGVDYFEYGDLVVMIMGDRGTEDIYDDHVLNAYKVLEH